MRKRTFAFKKSHLSGNYFSVDKQVLPPANDSSTRDDIDELLYEQLLKRVSNT